MANKNILVAVSGGPDSIYLLNSLYNKKKYNISAAHINYHLREESNNDEELVKDYCKKKNINLFLKNISQKDWDNFFYLKNKQSIAREIRYDFFLEIMNKNNIDKLYIGHHKDDFIETALMQEKKSDKYLYYGIKEKSLYKDKKIIRPLLNLYKEDIILYLRKNKINFAIDKTNTEPIYERNIIRQKLSLKTKIDKDKIYKYYLDINKSKEILRKKVDKIFDSFKKSEYDILFFNKIDKQYKEYIIYLFLIKGTNFRININSNKIKQIINFIEKNNFQKKYRLMEKTYLKIKYNKLKII